MPSKLYTPWMAQAGQKIGDAIQSNRARGQREQLNKLAGSAYMGDPQAMQELMQVNPQLGVKIQEGVQRRKKGADQAALSKRSSFTKETKEIMGNIAKFGSFEEAKEYGDKMTQDIASRYPEIIQQVGADAVFDEEDFNQAKTMFGGKGGKEGKIGLVSPKDFTVESIGKYQETGKIEDLDRFSPKTAKIAGVVHSLNPQTQKWEPIVDATSEKLSTQAKALADIEADKKSRLDFAKSATKWKTGKPKFASKIASTADGHNILVETSDQIKKLVSGWSTRYGSSLSGLPGSEARKLKNLINTVRAHSALSTLTALKASGGTLGAISEAELVLLESKLGAIDQGGESDELIRVVDQIVNSNSSSISRLQAEFDKTDAMYEGGFDELNAPQPLSDEDLIQKYGG